MKKYIQKSICILGAAIAFSSASCMEIEERDFSYFDKVVTEEGIYNTLQNSVNNTFSAPIAGMLLMRRYTTLRQLAQTNHDFISMARLFAMCGKVLVYSNTETLGFIERTVLNNSEISHEITQCLQVSEYLRNKGIMLANNFSDYLTQQGQGLKEGIINMWSNYLNTLNTLMLEIATISNADSIKLLGITRGTFTLYAPEKCTERFPEVVKINKALRTKGGSPLHGLIDAMVISYDTAGYHLRTSDVSVQRLLIMQKTNPRFVDQNTNNQAQDVVNIPQDDEIGSASPLLSQNYWSSNFVYDSDNDNNTSPTYNYY